MKTENKIINPITVPIEEIKNYIKITAYQIKFVLGDFDNNGCRTINAKINKWRLK